MDFLIPMIEEMKQHKPELRPTIAEVFTRWNSIRSQKASLKSWRLSPRSETTYERAFNDTVAAAWGGLKTLKSYVRSPSPSW